MTIFNLIYTTNAKSAQVTQRENKCSSGRAREICFVFLATTSAVVPGVDARWDSYDRATVNPQSSNKQHQQISGHSAMASLFKTTFWVGSLGCRASWPSARAVFAFPCSSCFSPLVAAVFFTASLSFSQLGALLVSSFRLILSSGSQGFGAVCSMSSNSSFL